MMRLHSLVPFWRRGALTPLKGPRRCGPARRDASPPHWLAVAGCLITVSLFAAPARAPKVDFDQHVKPLLENYCYECHGDGAAKSGLALDSYKTVADVHAARPKWEA